MAQIPRGNIPTEKFLLIAINLLHQQFVGAARTQAKRVYREFETGRILGITTVKMEDESTVRFNMVFDHSEFQGKLNFGTFRASLSILLGNIAKALQDKSDITSFNIEDNADSVLFGVTGVTVEDEQHNVMMLGCDRGEEAGAVTLRLMYMSPDQFVRRDGESGADAAGTS